MHKNKISTGLNELNRILNDLFIGDNVIWYDDAGSLAGPFVKKFISESQKQNKSLIYVSFDRSPKNLINNLDILAENQQLTILDCFTNGKGDKAEIFNKFYEKDGAQWPYQIIKVTRPEDPQAVIDAILGLHKNMAGDVRLVFESLTGMADLWNGEDQILKFYSHTCPRLYELDTIAYWIIEDKAHSDRLKAHINQIAQVAISLSAEQGKTRINLLKAENRSPKNIGKPLYYKFEDNDLVLEDRKKSRSLYDIGTLVKHFRKAQGMSQKDLSRLVGVTPSNISQIENNQVLPSIPALYKISSHLSVDIASFFDRASNFKKFIFPKTENRMIPSGNEDTGKLNIEQLTPFDLNGKIELFNVTIAPGKRLTKHFFKHKGEEAGILLEGEIQMTCQDQVLSVNQGDTVYLKSETPASWSNKSDSAAQFLWIKIR